MRTKRAWLQCYRDKQHRLELYNIPTPATIPAAVRRGMRAEIRWDAYHKQPLSSEPRTGIYTHMYIQRQWPCGQSEQEQPQPIQAQCQSPTGGKGQKHQGKDCMWDEGAGGLGAQPNSWGSLAETKREGSRKQAVASSQGFISSLGNLLFSLKERERKPLCLFLLVSEKKIKVS